MNPKSPLLRILLHPFGSEAPTARLVRQTARQQWRLVAVNLVSGLAGALSEGATLGVVFLAVEVLSAPIDKPFDFSLNPLFAWSPPLAAWLNGLPSTPLFISMLGLAMLLQGLQSFARFINLVSVGYFAARCRSLLTARIHSQVLSFTFPCASGYKVGDLTDYASQGPEAVRSLVKLSGDLVVALLLALTYLGVLVGISPWMLLAVLFIGVPISLLQKQLLPRITAGSRAQAQIQVAISTRITEDFQSLRLLHSSGQLDAADQRLRSRMRELESQLRLQARRLAVVGPFSSFLPIFAISVIAALGQLLLGERSSGLLANLVTFVLALQRLNTQLGAIAKIVNDLANNSGRIQRLDQILYKGDKQFRRRDGSRFTALRQSIEFEQVSLRYAPDHPPAIQDLTFTLPKGKMLALVGSSGAGKSSIADLLTGLYRPSSGCIRIDGTRLDQWELSSWQQRLGVVSQDTILLNATISENIAFGMPRASQSKIEAACVAAQAADFIESLPHGYETLVGERGYRLSGGQRQRLSLARAIVREPDLLILDEATSALDSQSELLVQEAIQRFESNHTMLVIAHRLSTIVRADQILVLDRGRLVQLGSHRSLLAEPGFYQQLWQKQSAAMQ